MHTHGTTGYVRDSAKILSCMLPVKHLLRICCDTEGLLRNVCAGRYAMSGQRRPKIVPLSPRTELTGNNAPVWKECFKAIRIPPADGS